MPTKDGRSASALAAAERLYKRRPDATTEEFRRVCERADKDTISKLSNREFNASYVLPFRRSRALKGRVSSKKGAKKPSSKRVAKKESVHTRTTTLVSDRALATARRLILDRDRQVLKTMTGSDPQAAYDLAAALDEFIVHLAQALKR